MFQSLQIYMNISLDEGIKQLAGGEKREELPLRRTLSEPQLHLPGSSSTGPKPPPES